MLLLLLLLLYYIILYYIIIIILYVIIIIIVLRARYDNTLGTSSTAPNCLMGIVFVRSGCAASRHTNVFHIKIV